MAVLYSNGFGVPKNETKAAMYFELAAYAGNSEALVNLGILHNKGFDDTPKNQTKAHEYWKKAA